MLYLTSQKTRANKKGNTSLAPTYCHANYKICKKKYSIILRSDAHLLFISMSKIKLTGINKKKGY